MTKLLIRLFIRNPENTNDPNVREAYGILAGFVGILLNLLLSAAKFVIGAISGSIAIEADAVNNLSDVGSSAITLFGSWAANRPADKKHPYGHARVEYIAALVIAFVILLVGVQLAIESVRKIIAPEPVEFSVVMIAVLVLSILAKLWMSRFTTSIDKSIHSTTLSASTLDSVCDMVSTGAILISTLVGYFGGINLDGYIGVLVAAFVLYSGISILRQTVSPLLGEAPDPELIREINERLMGYDHIIGVHDMLVHSYGPGRVIASAHAEVRSDGDIMLMHETMDTAEREIGEALNIILTLHMDPVEVDNIVLNEAMTKIDDLIKRLDARVCFHDFRMVTGEERTNLLFDIVVPPGMQGDALETLKQNIQAGASEINPAYQCIIQIDYDYSGLLNDG